MHCGKIVIYFCFVFYFPQSGLCTAAAGKLEEPAWPRAARTSWIVFLNVFFRSVKVHVIVIKASKPPTLLTGTSDLLQFLSTTTPPQPLVLTDKPGSKTQANFTPTHSHTENSLMELRENINVFFTKILFSCITVVLFDL